MKQIRNFLMGLGVLILATAATANSRTAITPAHNAKKLMLRKKNITDQLAIVFTFTATASGITGYYNITINCNEYDITTQTLYALPCPENISISITSGPYSGEVFSFPSGYTTYGIGAYPFATNPTGSNYTIVTNPTSFNGFPIDQNLVGGQIL
ncbi:hypothetical protein HDF18_14350 [Mucilaginibacter sp. X5P1]|uniref:hypothetical protein n=1 Tax=Mucilaginibacter sp. X5P1 TaxID=2723088 RepID=UPI00161BE852|nr:hypothetical protein [Mucilaginibacter sp. X5P1]MBB6138784.1 hypothetical protein [Mucilaginibacter sp. X5P1]